VRGAFSQSGLPFLFFFYAGGWPLGSSRRDHPSFLARLPPFVRRIPAEAVPTLPTFLTDGSHERLTLPCRPGPIFSFPFKTRVPQAPPPAPPSPVLFPPPRNAPALFSSLFFPFFFRAFSGAVLRSAVSLHRFVYVLFSSLSPAFTFPPPDTSPLFTLTRNSFPFSMVFRPSSFKC